MAATVKMPGRTSRYTALTLNNWKYLGTDDPLVDANQGSDVARAFRLACGLPPWTAPNPSAGGAGQAHGASPLSVARADSPSNRGPTLAPPADGPADTSPSAS